LEVLRRELHDGKGFGCVRGLNLDRYSVEDQTVMQLGIQVHIANRYGRQDDKGNMMGKVACSVPNTTETNRQEYTLWPTALLRSKLATIATPPPQL
jgi:hypothetical protein